ncbi:hypothetical protein RF11_14142 [Thelohanellus kitauei]|uniref:Uncharacterized protein n=1 Tax=Thelohanellus kitauei TaxID=669202 RepID=A0A0C2M4L2_THEKT|nr:hypothetical protein RF11_14142 [Thelohanellus kitauei]
MATVVKTYLNENNFVDVLKNLVKFYSKKLDQEFENNPCISDSARLTSYIISAFSIMLEEMAGVIIQHSHASTIEKATILCLSVINRFKDNEQICGDTCSVLYEIIYASREVYNNHITLFERVNHG